MHAITLRPQWAYAVARLGKDVENRTWPLPARMHGQRIAIHAAAGAPDRAEMHDYVRRTQFQTLDDDWKWNEHQIDRIRGALVATAVVSPMTGDASDLLRLYGTPWGSDSNPYQWALTDVQPLATPLPCRGAQGFWRVPPAVERLIAQWQRLEKLRSTVGEAP
jgi:hypothetical protein